MAVNTPCGSSPQPFGCAPGILRGGLQFSKNAARAKPLSGVRCDPSFLRPLGPSCLNLFYHRFYFYGRNLIICFPQARSSDSLETVLQIKNKYPNWLLLKAMCLPLADWGESHQVQKKNTNIPNLATCQSHYKQITVKWMSSGGCVVSWEEAEKEYQGFGLESIFQLLTFRFYLVVLMPLVDNLFVKTSGLETEWPGRFCQRLQWRKLWFLGNRMREGAVWVTQASTSPACSFRSHIFEYNGRDSGFILRLLSILSTRSLSLSLSFPRANTCSDLITFLSSWNQAPRCPEDLWLCPESLVVDRPRVPPPLPPIPSSFIARPHEGKRCPMVQGPSWWHRRRQRALSPSRSSSQVTLWS